MAARSAVVVCVLFLGMCIATSGVPTEIPHGYCRVVWLLGLPCDQVNAAIVTQIRAMKSYKLIPVTSSHIEATHTSAVGQTESVAFSMRPSFMEQGCHMEGSSVSAYWESQMKGATNYCNLYNIIQRSGLTKAPGFLQFANEWLCPGYKPSSCA